MDGGTMRRQTAKQNRFGRYGSRIDSRWRSRNKLQLWWRLAFDGKGKLKDDGMR